MYQESDTKFVDLEMLVGWELLYLATVILNCLDLSRKYKTKPLSNNNFKRSFNNVQKWKCYFVNKVFLWVFYPTFSSPTKWNLVSISADEMKGRHDKEEQDCFLVAKSCISTSY